MGKCVSVNQNEANTVLKSQESLRSPDRKHSYMYIRQPTLRHSIKSKVISEAKNAIVTTDPPGPKLAKDLIGILQGHFLFTLMPVEKIKHLIKKMKTYTLEENEIVYTQGNIGINFFIVIKGTLDLQRNDESVSTLNPNDCFGELGLIQDEERDSTVTTLEKSVLRGIDRSSYRQALSFINEKKHEENFNFIKSVPLFKELTNTQLQQLLPILVMQKFTPGQRIVTEGEAGDLLYIVKEGTVHCTKKGVLLRDFNIGESFGEQALLYQSKRKATITAAGKAVLISIGRNDLITALGQKLEKIIYRNTIRIAFSSDQFVKNLSAIQVDLIIDKMEVKSYAEGDLISPQGSPKGEEMVVVLKGQLSMGETKFRHYDIIGSEEIALNNSRKNFKDNLIVDEECDLGIITKSSFENTIGGDIKSVLLKNNLIEILKNVNLFRILPISKLQRMIDVLSVKEFSAGAVIFQQGSNGDGFYIVSEGSVDIIKDGSTIRTVEINGFFGERSVILEEVRTATAKANSHTKCWVLDKNNFRILIDEKIHQELLKRIELQNDSINLTDLRYVQTLAKGIYGNNFLCATPSSRTLLVLKTISRHKIALYNLSGHLMTEKRILRSVDHPFIVKLIRTFKDESRVYFLSEHIQGIDLFDVLATMNKVTNEQARFFAAGILVILEYLHTHNIMYRDLKPENVFIDLDGYPKMIEFGNAKIMEHRTYSTVGTPHYMAPEVISGKGYTFTADYWSLGIMIYEFLFNKLPFCADESDCYVIYQSILQNSLIYPISSHIAKPLIDQLLLKDPIKRGNFRTIKEHSWFIGINWDSLLAKDIRPPFNPQYHNYDKEIAANRSKGSKELMNKISVSFM